MEIIKCRICGSEENRTLFVKDGFNIIRCNICKAVYAYPFLSAKEISVIYEQESYYTQILEHDNRQDESKRFPWRSILDYIASLLENKGSLLDIGSGTGLFLDLARKNGWNVCGVESSRFAHEYSIKEYNLNIINKPLKDVGFKDESFNVVTLWNVLEHLSDPLDMVLASNKIIKENGIIAFSVPNIDSFEAALFRNKWSALEPKGKGHLYYFSPRTVNFILNKAGFKLERMFSLGGFGFRAHMLKDKTSLDQKNKFTISECAASIARYAVSILKKGGILIAIARKQKKYEKG